MAKEIEKKFSVPIFAGVGGGTSDNKRRTNHYSQQRPRFVDEIPTQESGVEGDIVYYENPGNLNKVEQYIKRRGEWINLSDGRPLNDSPVVRKFVKAKSG
jgi:hypothetical protein|tara:strand:+ start:270 stop:569 length:300 start_codon:yes stop_codon:yes gene_type:complete